LHPDDGIGLEDIDETRRTRIPTQTKRIINLKNKKENLGEELRILYVALTRAKEKLILVGTGKTDQNYPKRGDATQPVTFFERMQANCYYDWVLPAIAPYADIYPVQTVTAEDLMQQQVEHVVGQELTKDMILAKASEFSKEEKEAFEQEFTYRYPYLDQTAVPSKMSVTELKMRAMRDADEDAYQVFEEQETKEAYVPAFIRKRDAALHTESGMMGQTTDAQSGGFMPSSRASGGAVRGSAIHRALECLDFAGDVSVAGIRAQLEKIRQEGRMTKEECSLVRARAMADFFASSLGTRMIAAQRAHNLYKEQPFVMGIEGREIEEHAGDELVLVQGIIDAFFEEEDGIVLVDYKTDHVKDEKTLADRYRIQLELYAKALERTMNRNVKEKILYSFALQEEIRL
jgi:ATP-dependent helicase/nuclease subunit A